MNVLPSRDAIVATAGESIARGSKSFALASRLFDRVTRERAWLLYAWCRRCDDLADGQDHGGTSTLAPSSRRKPGPINAGASGESRDSGESSGDIADLGPGFRRDDGVEGRRAAITNLAEIRSKTETAMAGAIIGDPAFDALRIVAAETGLPRTLVDAHIAGFALDAADWRPRTEDDLLTYCWHVAGAVGCMMAVIMGVSPADRDTLDRACDLGIAFQLANIARDIAEDDRGGRCYLPVDWLVEMDILPGEHMKPFVRPRLAVLAKRLADMAERYETSARVGAAKLPFRARWAVLAAAGIYGNIAREVAARGEHAWDRRVVTSGGAKAKWVAKAMGQAMGRPAAAGREALWTRP